MLSHSHSPAGDQVKASPTQNPTPWHNASSGNGFNLPGSIKSIPGVAPHAPGDEPTPVPVSGTANPTATAGQGGAPSPDGVDQVKASPTQNPTPWHNTSSGKTK